MEEGERANDLATLATWLVGWIGLDCICEKTYQITAMEDGEGGTDRLREGEIYEMHWV